MLEPERLYLGAGEWERDAAGRPTVALAPAAEDAGAPDGAAGPRCHELMTRTAVMVT